MMMALFGHPWLRLASVLAVTAAIALIAHPERGPRRHPKLSLPAISTDDLHRQFSRRMRDSIKKADANPDDRNSLYAWTWSYFALGCLKAAEATHEVRFLNLVSRDLRTIAAHRDDRMGVRDVPLDRVLPAWGAVVGGDPWHNGPAINGRIAYVIARFAEVRTALGVSDNQPWINRLLNDSMEAIESLDLIRLTTPDGEADYYVEPNGGIHALNHMASLGAAMAVLYRVTGDERLKWRVERLAKFFKLAFVRTATGGYTWPYIFTPGAERGRPEGLNKAAITILFPIEACSAEIGFDDADILALQQTLVTQVLVNGEINAWIDKPLRRFADPRQCYNLLPWMELDRFNPEIRRIIIDTIDARSDLFDGWQPHRLGWMMYPHTLMPPAALASSAESTSPADR